MLSLDDFRSFLSARGGEQESTSTLDAIADGAPKQENTRSYKPVSVSVIMPVRNEAKLIERSLEAVLSQDYPPELLEVIISDGMSDDGTPQLIAAMADAHPGIDVTVIENRARAVPTGLNLALIRSRGEVLVRVDGHTIIAPNYVRECVAALQASGAGNVGGRMNAVSQDRFGTAAALATSSPFGVGGARFHYSAREEWVDTVYLGAWPRQTFELIGLFDEEQVRNQDDEFNYRLLEHKGRILLSPKIRSNYFTRSTLRSLWRQYYQYGLWKVRVLQKHPKQMRLYHFVPPLFVGIVLLTLGLAPFTEIGKWAMVSAVGCYAVANAGASALTLRQADWRLIALIMLTFATIHLSWGLGFLWGFAKFRNRWNDKGEWKRLPKKGSFELLTYEKTANKA